MKILPTTRYCYAVAVQNGERAQYFVRYFHTKDKALSFAKNYRGRYTKQRETKRLVRIWYLIDTFVEGEG